MASRVGDGVTIFSTASKSSYTTGTDGGANYTVGSGANRVLLIAVHGYTDTTGGAKGASSVTHNGQSATNYGITPTIARSYSELWYIVNPTAGAGGTTVATNSLNRAMRVEVLEANDTDQTTPIHATNTGFGTGSTSTKTFSLTTNAADSLLVAMVSVQSGAGTFSASDGGTLTASGGGQTGTSGFSDVSGAVAYEAVPTAGAQTLTISWVNANDTSGLMVEVLNAAGGDTPVSLDAPAYTQTLNAITVAVDMPVALDSPAYTQTINDLAIAVDTPVALDALAYSVTLNDISAATGGDTAVPFDALAYTVALNDIGVAVNTPVALDVLGYAVTLPDLSLATSVTVALDSLSYTMTLNDMGVTVDTGEVTQPGGWLPIKYVDRKGREVDLAAVEGLVEEAVEEITEPAPQMRAATVSGRVMAALARQEPPRRADLRELRRLLADYQDVIAALNEAVWAQQMLDDEITALLLAS